ncbi:MAG: TetR/AcrR family transcriptional regulator [Enterobacterales bacterium]|nr:TetR/AcrR family transcriptional regulator [Enterobacterales bacterium]
MLNAAKKEFVEKGLKGASIKKIAEIAGIPRSNIHYYFKNKTEIYQQLLAQILQTWNQGFANFTAEDDPKKALTQYIYAKVMYSKDEPEASKIVASELIHGAPILSEHLNTDFKDWVREKADVIQQWIDKGAMDPINPYHLLFLIWSSTQHYANFDVEVVAALGKNTMAQSDYQQIAESITTIVLKGCGLE